MRCQVARPVRRAGRGNGSGAIPTPRPGPTPTCATRRCVTERGWKTFAVVLSQQRDEAGGSLSREMLVRVESSPDNAGTDQHYRMVRVRQARQEGVREEPVF